MKLVQVFEVTNKQGKTEIIKIQSPSPSRARKIIKLYPGINQSQEFKYLGQKVEN